MFSLWRVGWIWGLCVGRVFVYFCVESDVGARGGLFCWPFWGGGPGVVPTLCTVFFFFFFFFFYMCCDASIVVTVFNSCPLCFLFNSLCCDASILVTFNSFPFCFLFFYLWLRVLSGSGVGLAGCGGALSPRWFALPAVLGRWFRCWSFSLLLCGLFWGAICCVSFRVSFCSCVFWVLLVLRLPRLRRGKGVDLEAFRAFVRFVFVWVVGFLFLFGSGKGCGLWLWHSLDFSLTFFAGNEDGHKILDVWVCLVDLHQNC